MEAQNHTDGELQNHTEHWVLALLMTLVRLSAEVGGDALLSDACWFAELAEISHSWYLHTP